MTRQHIPIRSSLLASAALALILGVGTGIAQEAAPAAPADQAAPAAPANLEDHTTKPQDQYQPELNVLAEQSLPAPGAPDTC